MVDVGLVGLDDGEADLAGVGTDIGEIEVGRIREDLILELVA